MIFQDLRSLLAEGRRFDIDDAVRIIINCCGELAHELPRGPITPARILLSNDGDVRIADFKADFNLIKRYTAPEILESARSGKTSTQMRAYLTGARPTDGWIEVDVRPAVVFALGCILWEMVAGAQLFDDDKAVMGRLPPLPDAPSALQAIVWTALATRVERRYKTPTEFGDALAGYLAARTVN